MKKISIALFLVFLAALNTVFAQVKYEKEYRIKPEEVPALALAFTAALDFEKRIHWYKEEGLEATSIEGKIKNRQTGKRYSIEFSPDGTFEDVEIEIDWNEVPRLPGDSIYINLTRSFEKFKIEKIQVQFTGVEAAVQQKIRNRSIKPGPEVNTHYELITKVKKRKEVYRLELLFNLEGMLIRQDRLVSKNTDNLEY